MGKAVKSGLKYKKQYAVVNGKKTLIGLAPVKPTQPSEPPKPGTKFLKHRENIAPVQSNKPRYISGHYYGSSEIMLPDFLAALEAKGINKEHVALQMYSIPVSYLKTEQLQPEQLRRETELYERAILQYNKEMVFFTDAMKAYLDADATWKKEQVEFKKKVLSKQIEAAQKELETLKGPEQFDKKEMAI